MTGERQPATDPPPWLREVIELVERRFGESGEITAAIDPQSPAAGAQSRMRRFWNRLQQAWEAISWEAWDGHG